MSRPLRLEFPGSLHHITSRGNARQNIFIDDDDRERFLELLGKCVERFSWILTAYVLMSNHFHLVVQLTEESLSRGLQWLNSKYPQTFNRRHGRVGHLLQGRPDIRLVQKERYAREVVRYVVLNPVRAGIVERPDEYPWSSHLAVLGRAPLPDWLAVDDLLVQFGSNRELARAAYREFVNAAIGIQTSCWRELTSQIFLGSDDWRQEIRRRVDLRPRSSDHPRVQRLVGTPSMHDVVCAVAEMFSVHSSRVRDGRGGLPRMLAAWIAWHEGQLTSSEIASGLRLRHAGHISRLVTQCDQQLSGNARLRDYVNAYLSTTSRTRAQRKA